MPRAIIFISPSIRPEPLDFGAAEEDPGALEDVEVEPLDVTLAGAPVFEAALDVAEDAPLAEEEVPLRRLWNEGNCTGGFAALQMFWASVSVVC